MPCETHRMENGQTAIVCTGRARKKKCASCGGTASRLCDYVIEQAHDFGERERTCDKPLCTSCAIMEGENDYCPYHPRSAPRQGTLAL